MFLDAARRHRIDLSQSIMIGDSEVDMLAGKNAGCKSVLVRNGCVDDISIAPVMNMDYVVKDLLEAAKIITCKGKA
jgi:D-glycero-D-manno-heptose 1,7-bisphosphate phosphatase